MDKYQALQQLLNDETKAKEIFTESIEETRENLKKIGLDFSIEELEGIAEKATVSTASGELDADDLENVAGGVSLYVLGNLTIGRVIIGVVSKWKKR